MYGVDIRTRWQLEHIAFMHSLSLIPLSLSLSHTHTHTQGEQMCAALTTSPLARTVAVAATGPRKGTSLSLYATARAASTRRAAIGRLYLSIHTHTHTHTVQSSQLHYKTVEHSTSSINRPILVSTCRHCTDNIRCKLKVLLRKYTVFTTATVI